MQHLVCGFLLAENISHGLLLRKVTAHTLSYLFYAFKGYKTFSDFDNFRLNTADV